MSLTAIGLAAGRIAIGAGIWPAPTAAWRALGLGAPDPRALALGRLAASRDLVLGAWQLAAFGDRRRLRRVTAAVAAVDGADALTFALAARDPTPAAPACAAWPLRCPQPSSEGGSRTGFERRNGSKSCTLRFLRINPT